MNELLRRIANNPEPPKLIIVQSLDQLAEPYPQYRKRMQHMITFKTLKEKGYQIEVNTTGAMIVDVIGQDDTDITDLDNAVYTQKDIIFDNVEQTYDLVNIETEEIVFHTDDYNELVAKIEKLVK